jgi:hypothetical protein
MTAEVTTAADRPHMVTAIPIKDGRGTTLHHCATCGALTYFQAPALPCPASLREALAALTAARGEVAMLTADRVALAAEVGRLRGEAGGVLDDVEYLLWMQSGKEVDYMPGAHAAHDWWRTCLRTPLDRLRAMTPTPVPTIERVMDHDFLPVAGHPDDDECTHRSDGTDLTYCGEPEAAHGVPTPGPTLESEAAHAAMCDAEVMRERVRAAKEGAEWRIRAEEAMGEIERLVRERDELRAALVEFESAPAPTPDLRAAVETLRDNESDPDAYTHPERVAGWLAACDAVLAVLAEGEAE